jgi:tRNA uridine 5-carboxymethylaminomethyl modification enzyme
LRADNADARLTELGYEIGCVSEERYTVFKHKMQQIESLTKYCKEKIVSYPEIESLGISVKHNGKKSLFDLLSYPNVDFNTLSKTVAVDSQNATAKKDEKESQISQFSPQIYEQVEIDAKYAGYLKREYEDIAVFKRDENLKIREDIDYSKIGGLSAEMVQRFTTVRPKTIGEASRITGVTPAAVTAILGYIKNA